MVNSHTFLQLFQLLFWFMPILFALCWRFASWRVYKKRINPLHKNLRIWVDGACLIRWSFFFILNLVVKFIKLSSFVFESSCVCFVQYEWIIFSIYMCYFLILLDDFVDYVIINMVFRISCTFHMILKRYWAFITNFLENFSCEILFIIT